MAHQVLNVFGIGLRQDAGRRFRLAAQSWLEDQQPVQRAECRQGEHQHEKYCCHGAVAMRTTVAV